MSSRNDDLAWAAFGFGAGVYSFFWGFKRLRRKRLIENIPTSKIRSLALGLVEVVGRADIERSLKSPLTHTPCVYYRFTIEEYRSSGKSGRWVEVAAGSSAGVFFWVSDDTGKILVLPQGAELEIKRDFEFKTGWRKPLPEKLKDILRQRGISSSSIFGSKILRFREWLIRSQDNVYVLGTARMINNSITDHKKDLNERIRKIKSQPERMAVADSNKDGIISQQEWDDFVDKIEAELLLERTGGSERDPLADIVIAKGVQQQVFIISDESQKSLITRLGAEAALGVYGGPILTILCLCYMIWRLSL
jgi:hypothetical protein